MTETEIQKKIEEIKLAIEKKDYGIKYYEPNNVRECTAPDGTKFLLILYMDDCSSSTDFGGNSIYIAGEIFYHGFDDNEKLESEYFDKIQELANTEGRYLKNYIYEIHDLLSSIDGFFNCSMSMMDDQVEIYNIIHETDYSDYFYSEESEKMIDIEDFTPISDNELKTIDFKGTSYYLIDHYIDGDDDIDNLDGDEYAVSFDATPDAYGCYDTVILKFENGKVKDVIESDKYYNSTNSDLK